MLQRLADMVRATTESASDLVFLDLNQRVAKFLIERAGGSTGEIHVIQADLAAAIGASRQRVNASLQEFQRRVWNLAVVEDGAPPRPRGATTAGPP